MERLIDDAELIRDWPHVGERLEAARRHIRQAMYLWTLGRGDHKQHRINAYTSITNEELHEVFSILDFAIEPVGKPSTDLWQDLIA